MIEKVTLHYHRPPDRTEVFVQDLLYADDHVLVSFTHARVTNPIFHDGQLMVEPGSPMIWFAFVGERYDVGLFHAADGRFTGLYADILEPVEAPDWREFHLHDLFVDVWVAAEREPAILDVAELEEAVKQDWVTAQTAATALAEAEHLVARYGRAEWPPPIVNEWTLERVTGWRTED